MYKLYNNEGLITTAPTLNKAKQVAVSLFKSTNEDIFVWRQRRGEQAELIMEVIDETKSAQ